VASTDNFEGVDLEILAVKALQRALSAHPDRLLTILETEQRRRHTRELLSLWLTAALLFLFGGAALLLGLNDHDWLAGVVFSTTVLGIGTIFILRQRPGARQSGQLPGRTSPAVPAAAAAE
jgi:hypothetical protein